MTKEVLIHLKGMQTTDDPHGSDDPLELITVGEYYYRNNTHYLLYEEQMEGLDEPIHNLDRKSTRLNSSHNRESRMPSSA